MKLLDLFNDPTIVMSFLSKAMQADLTSYLIIVFVIWRAMGKQVSAHFLSIEQSVGRIAHEIAELKSAVMADFETQVSRVDNIEDRVELLEGRKG